MALSEALERKLKKRFEPSTMVAMRFKGNELEVKTDSDGNAILLFIGKRDHGRIKGERYARRLKMDEEGKVIKDHWELKGKAT